MDRLNRFLKKAREGAGFTQLEFAKKLGYAGSQFVSNCERNACNYPLSKFTTIARLLNVKVEKLVNLHVADIREKTVFEIDMSE
jgi:transcriptional regulator with XRE-family HTH domain